MEGGGGAASNHVTVINQLMRDTHEEWREEEQGNLRLGLSLVGSSHRRKKLSRQVEVVQEVEAIE